MVHVPHEAFEAGAGLEAGEAELVEDDDRQPGQRDLQRVAVENRDADQRQRKEDEIEGNAEQRG